MWLGVLAWYSETLYRMPVRSSVTYAGLLLILGAIAVGAELLLHRLQRTGRTDDEWVAEVRDRQARVKGMVVTFGSLVAVAAIVALLQ